LFSSKSKSELHTLSQYMDLFVENPLFASVSPPVASNPMTKQQPFYPYVDNGGTVMAVAGSDYVVVAGDTRLSTGYSIHTRYAPKIVQLTDKCVLATSGMQADIKTLHKLLQARVKIYEHLHRKTISVSALAQMISNALYYKRFFPYYTFNILAGIDESGQGVVYGYDAVGSMERVAYCTAGTGTELIQPLFDSQVAGKNQNRPRIVLSEMEAVDIVKDAINSAAERDIYTGDYAEIYVINRHGIRKEECELRHD
jgi:20S proteasome subunit beta 6